MYTLPLHRITLAIALMLATDSVAVAKQTAASNPATAYAKPKPAKPALEHGTSKPGLLDLTPYSDRAVDIGKYDEMGTSCTFSNTPRRARP